MREGFSWGTDSLEREALKQKASRRRPCTRQPLDPALRVGRLAILLSQVHQTAGEAVSGDLSSSLYMRNTGKNVHRVGETAHPTGMAQHVATLPASGCARLALTTTRHPERFAHLAP